MPSGIFSRTEQHRENISHALMGRIRPEKERVTMRVPKTFSQEGLEKKKKTSRESALRNPFFQRRQFKAFVDGCGYWCVYKKVEGGTTRKFRVHRLIAEKILGRKLRRGECVHHINMITTDNRHKNLLICTNGYHRQLHSEMARRYAIEHFGIFG